MQVVPPQQTGLDAFTAAFMKGMEMGQNFQKMRLLREESEREKEKLGLTKKKEERDLISGIAKGELPSTMVPQSLLRPGYVQPEQKFEIPAEFPYSQMRQGMVPQRRVEGETPQQFGTNLMSGYAQQQQAVNPYRALQGEKLAILQPIYEKVAKGIPLNETEKILIGLQVKEGTGEDWKSLITGLMGGAVPPTQSTQPEGLMEVTNPQGKRVKIKQSQLADALKQGYKQ